VSELTALTETASKRRLGDAIALPGELATADRSAAVAFVAERPSQRFVAKASGIAHKTDGNLVRLGLSAAEVAACFDELAAAGDGTVVVAEFVDAETELLVGGVRDKQFGPVITIGAGGIAAEAAPDVVAILAPPQPGEVTEALARLRIAPLLAGWRGSVPLDTDAFAALVTAVAAQFDDPAVVEVEVNPVAVVAGRPIVLDALVVLADPGVTP